MPQVNDQGAGSLALTPCRNVVKPTTSAAYVSFLFRCYSKPDFAGTTVTLLNVAPSLIDASDFIFS